MNKLLKLVRAALLLLRKPYLVNLLLDSQERNKDVVIKKYGLERGLPKVQFTALTDARQMKVEPYTFLEGGSLPTDYMLLRILSEKFSSCRYFEIGTWRGESAANVAAVASEVFTLNLSPEEMGSHHATEQYIRLQGFFSNGSNAIKQLYGNSAIFDFAPFKNRFDLIFIDGDHHYESVKNDTEKCYSLRSNEKSIMVWHDYGNTTEAVRWEVLRGILDGLPVHEHKHLYAVSNTLCAIYYPYPISSHFPEYPQEPSLLFSLNMELKKIK